MAAFVPTVPIRSSTSTSNANQVCISTSSFTPLRPPASRPIPIPNANQNQRHRHRTLRHYDDYYYHHRKSSDVVMQAVDVETREVVMPALSSTMEEGKIVQWLKNPGDAVATGEPIMVVESDKADMDVESFEDGYLAVILVEEGQSAPVGSAVALIVESKDDISKVSIPSASTAVSNGSPAPTSSTPASSDSSSTASEAVPKPNFVEVVMPALSSTMTEGKIVDWLKSEGDTVNAGEMIMVVESDKADMDVEAFDSGVIAHVGVQSGESAPVGSAVAYLAETADDVAAIKAWVASSSSSTSVEPTPAAPTSSTTSSVTEPTATTATTTAPVTSGKVVNEGRIIASPRAKIIAIELGVDLRFVSGSGPNGRVVEKDVRKAHEQGITFGSSQVSATAAGSSTTEYKSDKVIATPDAKKVAKQEGIDLGSVKGTGNFGRIIADDVLRAAGKAPEPVVAEKSSAAATAATSPVAPSSTAAAASESKAPGGSVSMNSLQKAVVNNMNASLSVPVFRITYEICTTKLDDLYAKVKPKGVTMSALLAKAVAATLRKHPIMNAAYAENAIVYREDINVAMAVATPDGGLITPTLKKADEVDLYSLSRTWKDMVKKASDKKLTPEEYSGGTFVISNLGMFGVTQFDAILPPGVPGILAVGASKPNVRMMDNGMVGVEKVMNVTLTADHRHIYGADGAKFLKDLAKLIEGDIMQLLM